MSWSLLRKRPSEEPPPPPAEPAAPRPAEEAKAEEELGHALDALGVMLRAFGRAAPGAEEEEGARFTEACERWARHLLVRTPAPQAERAPEPGETVRRDWAGLRRFFVEHRARETAAVGRNLTALRETIVSFVRDLGASTLRSRDADRRVAAELERLQSALRSGSLEALREATAGALRLVERVQEERSAEQQRRLQALEAQRAVLEEQLAVAWQSDGNRDAVTRLANRRALGARLESALDMSTLFGQAACLYLLDIDRFKGVNDLHGHLAGDAVLAAVADTCVRVFPSKEELVARFGGDEFAVVVPAGEAKEVLRLGERLLRAVRALRVVHDGREIPVSVSVGAAVLAPGESADDWTRRADRALYKAKAAGRDRLVLAEAAGEAAEAA